MFYICCYKYVKIMGQDNEDLIKFLKEHLKIEMEDDGRFLTVKILIGNEVITVTDQQICR